MSDNLAREKYYKKYLNSYPQSLGQNDEILRKAFDTVNDYEVSSYAQLFCMASLTDERTKIDIQSTNSKYVMDNVNEGVHKRHSNVLNNLHSINVEIKDRNLTDQLKEYLQFVRYIHVVDHCEKDAEKKELMVERYNHKLMNIFSEMSSDEIKQVDELDDLSKKIVKIPSMRPTI